MSLVSQKLTTWSGKGNDIPEWANKPNFGLKNAQGTYKKYYAVGHKGVFCDYYGPNPQPPNPRPNPIPTPPNLDPEPPNPPQPPELPVTPTPTEPPTPPVDPNLIEVSGTRQANGQQNIFTFNDRPGEARTVRTAPGTGAIINNLFNDINAQLDGEFTGYIGARELNLTRPSSGDQVTGIFHSFGTFGDPTDNTAGTAPINIDLGSASNTIPHRVIAVAGEGNINMRGGDLALLSSRDGSNGNNGFRISEARSVRIGAETLNQVGDEGNFTIWQDERGSLYRINNDAVVTNVSRDRANFEDTREDVPGQSGPNFIFQQGQLPHATTVNVQGQPQIILDELLPFRRDRAPNVAQQNQPTLRGAIPTATGINAMPFIPAFSVA